MEKEEPDLPPVAFQNLHLARDCMNLSVVKGHESVKIICLLMYKNVQKEKQRYKLSLSFILDNLSLQIQIFHNFKNKDIFLGQAVSRE